MAGLKKTCPTKLFHHGVATEPHAERTSRAAVARCSAFTLTEVVAACLAVGLLACAVMPSLEATRQASQYGTCLDRLRAIASATAAYTADDSDGQALPVHPLFAAQDPANPSYIGAYEWGGKSGIGRPGWFDGFGGPEMTSKYGAQAGFGASTRPLNTYLYPHGFRDHNNPAISRIGWTLDTRLDLPAFRCPADDAPPLGAHCPDWLAHPTRSSYDHFGTSYAANIFMISSADDGLQRSNSPYLRPLSRVPNPARTYFYEENIGRWAWAARRENDDCQWLGDGVDPGPTKRIPGWHGKAWTFNHAYGDGHAVRRALYIDGTEDADGYAIHYLTEQVYEDEEQQAQYRCIIVRGEGWQKDTLPDEPIYTDLQALTTTRTSYEDCVVSDW